MFINCIVKLFFRFRFTLNTLIFTALAFSNQLHAQEKNVISIEEESNQQVQEDLTEKKSRVRRQQPQRKGRTRAGRLNNNPQQSLAPLPPHNTPPGSPSTSNPSGIPTTPTKNTTKRPSQSNPQGSPPKQAKPVVVQKPVVPPPNGIPIVYAPTVQENQDRHRARERLKPSYSTLSLANPQEPLKSFRHFRLQWNINNAPNTGMDHILRRHTYEYHDGTSKNTQSMFPRGTTDTDIKNMIQEVLKAPNKKPYKNPDFGPGFLQVVGDAMHQGKTIRLAVGYKENKGVNKALDIVQAFPVGKQYEVQVLPSPTRRRRGAGSASRIRMMTRTIVKHLNLAKLFRDYFKSQKHKPSTLGVENFLDPSPVIEQGLNSINTSSQSTKKPLEPITTRNNIKNNLGRLSFLSLAFSNIESSLDSISLTWKTITDRSFQLSFPYTKQYEFYKNDELITQNDSTTLTDQPNDNEWTEYKIVFTDSEGNRKEGMPLKVGAKKITNLKATTTSDNKVLLEWDPVNHENKQITYVVFRYSEGIAKRIATLDTNSFEDGEVEPNQKCIYRVLVFIQSGNYIMYSQPLIINEEQIEGSDSFLLYTHLLSEEVPDLNELGEHPEEYYTPISEIEASSVIVQNSIITWNEDESVEMLNGMIDVVANGRSLVSPRCFDNVRMLWDYLLTMVAQYIEEGQAKVYFPDQPIVVSLQRQGQGTVEFQIDDQFVTIDEKQCLTAILQAAEQFFTLLNEVSTDKYSLVLEQIKAMQNQVLTPLAVQPILQVQVQRTLANEVLLSWTPNSVDIKSYEVLINEEPLDVLPAEAREYRHNIQQTDQFEKCVYKLIVYDQDDKELETYSREFEITTSYLQVEKITENVFELSWLFLGQKANSIESYEVYRNEAYLGELSKNATTLKDTTLLAPGVYNYAVDALDKNGRTVEMAGAELLIVREEYLRADVIAPSAIELSWEFLEENEARIQTYRISRNGTFVRYVLKNQVKKFTDTVELGSGEYTYVVEARDSSGNSIETKQVVVRIDD